MIPDPAGPAGVNPGTDPRTAGLFAYLCDDYDTAIREWTRFEAARDPLAPPDPLVSAALGVLYLFEEQPARAYPRLRDAVRAFPDVGFLTLYLADAAVKCGDAEDAGLLLERAGSQPRRDPFGGELRVRAAILAAGGDLAGADALYRSAELRGPGWLEHARLMERVGREDEAICRYLGAAELGGPVPLRAYREALERWWRSLPPAERLRNIRASLDLPRHDPRSLATRLRVYAEGAEGKGAFLCRLLPSSCLRACVPACLFWISTTLFDALSSPSLQSLSLSELAKRMEVEDMSLWSRITSFPRVLKELHFTLWRWPGAPGFARRMDATASMIRQLFSARGVRRALTSAVLVAGTPTVSAQSKHYDASLGTLPQAQGWTLTDTGESPAPVVAGGALHQGPTSGNPSAGYQFWGRNDQAISFADGFVLEARLRVISSNFVPDTPEHWVVGYSLEAFDSAGQFIALGIASDGVGLTSTGSFAPTDPLVPFDTTDGFHTYRMVVVGGSATLYVDGVVMATGAPGQLSDQNNVRFGDLAHLGTSETELEYVAYGGLCTAAPCFQGLGDLPGGTYFSIAGCLSSNGTTVGGGSATAASASAEWNHEAFIWRADTGMVYLGDLPGASNWGHVLGLSADGEIAVGASASGNGDAGWERREAFRWTEATGMVALGDLGGGSFNSEATEISDDGALVAGWGNAATGWHAATWSSATGWVDVDPAGPHGRFLALSRNGEWAVGDRGINNNVARRWSAATGLLDLGIPAGSSHAYPYAVSDDGETVVGAGYGATRAFIWTPADGMQGLDDLPGGLQANQAIGMTRDGRLIVGDGTSDLGLEAVLWDESRVVHRVSDVLAANGVGLPPGWILRSAYDVVINGSEVTLCGYGDNPQGHTEAWIARFTLPAEPCPGDVDADGDVDLDDLLIVLGAFAQLGPGSPGDADGDGDTDLDDLLLILGNFGQPCD